MESQDRETQREGEEIDHKLSTVAATKSCLEGTKDKSAANECLHPGAIRSGELKRAATR